jgi:hypothetical protein
MDAETIIADWKRRLTELANNPPYVFRDTPHHLIQDYYRRLTSYAGYSEAEISSAEERLCVKFPVVFRTFLREMARSGGELFRGSHLAGLSDFEDFRDFATEIITDTDPTLSLPPNAVVFLEHHGYTFLFMQADGGFDAPIMQWIECEREPKHAALGFAELVDAELMLKERNNRSAREKGGYYLTLFPDGTTRETHPALADGERPLDN